ncbi:MAG TPA: peptidylprolyl isomerase, partial [Arenimonas sp.]|nr:peptidylprolyl isomerase [Arenimonas sp.]
MTLRLAAFAATLGLALLAGCERTPTPSAAEAPADATTPADA